MWHVREEGVGEEGLGILGVGVLGIGKGGDVLADEIEGSGFRELIVPARDQLVVVINDIAGRVGEVSKDVAVLEVEEAEGLHFDIEVG